MNSVNHPKKCLKLQMDILRGILKNKKLVEYYNFPRQKFAKSYLPNGYIDIIKPSIILTSNLLHGNKILPFITNQTNDIDVLDDFKKNNFGFIQGRLTKQKKKIQQFPKENWKKEFRIARKLKLKLIEWTIDHYGFFKNPLLNKKYIKTIKKTSKINNIKINSVTADFFMEKPF